MLNKYFIITEEERKALRKIDPKMITEEMIYRKLRCASDEEFCYWNAESQEHRQDCYYQFMVEEIHKYVTAKGQRGFFMPKKSVDDNILKFKELYPAAFEEFHSAFEDVEKNNPSIFIVNSDETVAKLQGDLRVLVRLLKFGYSDKEFRERRYVLYRMGVGYDYVEETIQSLHKQLSEITVDGSLKVNSKTYHTWTFGGFDIGESIILSDWDPTHCAAFLQELKLA